RRPPPAPGRAAAAGTSSAPPARPPGRRRCGCGPWSGRARSAPRAPARRRRPALRPARRRRGRPAGRGGPRPGRARARPAPRRARPRPPLRAPRSMLCVLAQDRVQLVLEAAVLDRAVHAALLGCIRLPPPAAGAVVLAGLDGTRAGGAADRRVALRVEPVYRRFVLAEVGSDLALRPLRERVELDDRAVVV